MSEYAAYRSVAWWYWGFHPAPICIPRSLSRRLIDATRSINGVEFRIPSRSGRILFSLERRSLLNVRPGAVQTGFFVVPERKPNRALCLHIGTAEHARQFHNQRCPRTIIISRLAKATPVHVGTNDIHFAWTRGADLCAIHLFAQTWSRWL